MPRDSVVPRPAKKSEYVLKYATKQAEKGWRDLVATIRNPMSETWDFLTRTPLTTTTTNYPLKGALYAAVDGATSGPADRDIEARDRLRRFWSFRDSGSE